MWKIGSRGVVGLLSVFAGSLILYNAWGPILVLAVLLLLVVNTCYSLLINDRLVSPYTLLALECVKETASELNGVLKYISDLLFSCILDFTDIAKRYCRQRLNYNMNRPRRSSYYLSSDSSKARDSSSYPKTNVNLLTPIPRRNFHHVDDWNEGNQYVENSESVIKHTSTPLVPWKKENMQNGEPQHLFFQRSPSKISPLQSRNHTLSRGEETIFSPEGSPWGTSISPKMRAKAGGIKTVQTIAGPLLASTRYNIDTKVYSDVTSPGLTTRLSKYASDINNKLLHQSQYGMGHFPKVNLNASPTPLINTKTAKMRMPVTVRIAQPDAIRYSSQEKHKMLNMVCHLETPNSPNVVQALREISLKRHASREDVTSELVKKQRTDGIYSEELETLEEMTQKRTRDESSKSDEEISPSHMSARPIKRSKGQSCNDILNSLSSSVHVLSGVKRKATDISRSSTPDLEKHFKSLDKSHNNGFSTFQSQSETPKAMQRYVSEPLPIKNAIHNPEQKPRRQISAELNTNVEEKSVCNQSGSPDERDHLEIERPQVMQKPKHSSPVKLADKLFMRAEPQNNEKLRNLIKEQEDNLKYKFSMEDKDEIKKKDIVNMRQTSMRARLQSMFDAISGKGANKINPDVVIQAEDVKDLASSAVSTDFTSLCSSTTTTNTNTSPILSPVVPILKTSVNKKSPIKHVTFSMPSGEPVTTTSASYFSTSENVSSKSEDAGKSEAPTSVGFSVGVASTGNSAARVLPFGINTSSARTSTIQDSSSLSSTSIATSVDTAPTASNTLSPITGTAPSIPTSLSNFSSTPQSLNTSQSSSPLVSSTVQSTTTQSTGFTFGAAVKSSTSSSLPTSGQSALVINQNLASSATTNLPSTSSTPTFNITTSTPATAPIFAFRDSNSVSQTTKSIGFSRNSSIEQNTPKTQAPPAFGSVSSSFSFPGSAAPVSNSSNLSNNIESTSSGFKTPITTPTFSFGSAPTTKPSSVFGVSTSTPTTSAPIFGGSNSTPSFGSTTNPTTNVGTNSTANFGEIPTNTVPNFAADSTASSFGDNNTNLNFGAANTNTVNPFGKPATTASIFRSPAMTVATTTPFGNTSSQNLFENTSASGTSSAFGTPKTTALIFGSNSNTPIFGTTTSTSSIFSNNNVSSIAPSTLPTFGPSATSSNMFSQGNTNINASPAAFGVSTTTPSLFSGANANATMSSTATLGTTANTCNQSKPPPAFGAATPSTFGSTGTSLFGAPATNSTGFSATSPGNNATPVFGSSNTALPVFGAQNPTTAASVTQNNSFGSGFGTTKPNTPSFGSTATTTAGFGTTSTNSFQASSNNFGSVNNNPPAYGSSSASSFGSQTGSVFGTTNTSAPAFGTPVDNNNGNNNTNVGGSFTFGGGQGQTQPISTFSFGGASANNNSNTSNTAGAPFQFGSSASKQATGFNFNAPSSAPNINFSSSAPPTYNAPNPRTTNFAAPAGGMFSIGTGSTAPRSRATRPRRQR